MRRWSGQKSSRDWSPADATPSNFALAFGGTDEYVAFGAPADVDFDGSAPFSVSHWVKRLAPVNAGSIISKAITTGNKDGWHSLATDSGSVAHFLIKTNAGAINVTANSVYSFDQWVHTVWTYDGSGLASGVTLYRNGVSIALTTVSDNFSGSSANVGDLLMGARGTDSGTKEAFFVGGIDEVSIFDKELSQSEVDEIYNSGRATSLLNHSAFANLLHWWRNGDESDSISTINDLAGSSNGTPKNMEAGDLTWGPPYQQPAYEVSAPGFTGSVQYNGTNQYHFSATSGGTGVSDNLSVSYWIKGTGANDKVILSNNQPGASGTVAAWYVQAGPAGNNQKIGFIVRKDGTNSNDRINVRSSINILDDSWHYVVMTFAAGVIKIYVDGAEDTGATEISSVGPPTTIHTAANLRFEVGAWVDLSSYKACNIASVGIYQTRVLEAAEVLALYNNGAGANEETATGILASLKHYYLFGTDTTPDAVSDSVGSLDLTGANTPIFDTGVYPGA